MSNAPIFRRCIFLFGVTSLLIFQGCSQPSDTATKGEASSANGPLAIKTLLTRSDVPESAKKKFEVLKDIGRTSISESEFEEVCIKAGLKDPATMEITSKFSDSVKALQPSHSEYSGETKFEYPKEASDAMKLVHGLSDYLRSGIDHFKQKRIFNLSDDERNQVVKFMDDVLQQRTVVSNKEAWKALSAHGSELEKQMLPQLQAEPMFKLCLGYAAWNSGEREKADLSLGRAISSMRSDDYPTRLAAFTARLYRSARTTSNSALSSGNAASMAKHWITKDFRARGTEERFALNDFDAVMDYVIAKADWPAVDEIMYLAETSSTLPPWIQSMILGRCHEKIAWRYRGNGYASEVTADGWKKFEEHCIDAHEHYEAALKINPRFPEAATSLMQISRVGHSEMDEDHWFEKAIKHEPDFQYAYSQRLYSLTPRWGGTPEEMIAFARKQAAKKQYAEGVPYCLPKCIFMLRRERLGDPKEIKKLISDPDVLAEAVVALEGLVEHNRDYILDNQIRDKAYLQTLLALFLSQTSQAEKAEAVFRELDGKPSVAAIEKFGAGATGTIDTLMARASAFGAEYGEDAKRLSKLMSVPFDERIANLPAIEELVGNISLSDESGGLYFERALNVVRKQKAFADGEVVELEFDPQFNQWAVRDTRHLTFVSNTTATFDNREGNRHSQIFHSADFPSPRMIEFTLSLPNGYKELPGLDTRGNTDPHFAPGILIGKAYDASYSLGVELSKVTVLRTPDAYKSRVRRGEIFLGLNDGRTLPRISFPYLYGSSTIQVYVDENYIEVYTDGQFLFRRRANELTNPAAGVALMGSSGVKGTGEINFSDIKVKKWSGIPAAGASYADLLDHYQKVCEAEPDNKWNQFWLGHAKHATGDLEGALKLYIQACEKGVNFQIAGFYIGDILDRQGKHEEAFDWYCKSACEASEAQGGYQHKVPSFAPKSTPQQWSCFRANWLSAMHGFEVGNDAKKAEVQLEARLPVELAWLQSCLKAMNLADPDEKISRLKETAEATPRKYRDIHKTILKQLKADGTVEYSTEAQPLYLKVSDITPFFIEGQINP